MSVRFYVGLDRPWEAQHFERACISIRTLARRRKPIICPDVLIDSGAFTELHMHGRYRSSVADYAAALKRLHDEGVVTITAAVAQDYMCEPFMLAKTGLTIAEHQRLTIDHYVDLARWRLPFPVMPVLQGYRPEDYAEHVTAYGDRLTPGMWVGVGSVCKRNASPIDIAHVLSTIKQVRPDLRLHGFGVKKTALTHPCVRALLYSADSMAWSYAARRQGRDAHDWREAAAFAAAVNHRQPETAWQMPLQFEGAAA
jgi:hypothetical protein